jgi:hypothetical protein
MRPRRPSCRDACSWCDPAARPAADRTSWGRVRRCCFCLAGDHSPRLRIRVKAAAGAAAAGTAGLLNRQPRHLDRWGVLHRQADDDRRVVLASAVAHTHQRDSRRRRDWSCGKAAAVSAYVLTVRLPLADRRSHGVAINDVAGHVQRGHGVDHHDLLARPAPRWSPANARAAAPPRTRGRRSSRWRVARWTKTSSRAGERVGLRSVVLVVQGTIRRPFGRRCCCSI